MSLENFRDDSITVKGDNNIRKLADTTILQPSANLARRTAKLYVF